MGIFSFLYDDRPGPGVRPDEPRKKGLLRYAEVTSRNIKKFYMSGLLAMLGALPFLLGLITAVATNAVMVLLPCSILGGMVAAPQISALADTVLRGLRNRPGFWWYDYCRAWKRDLKASLLPGALTGLLVGVQVFTLVHVPAGYIFSLYMLVMLLSVMLSAGICVWLWAQVPLIKLGFGQQLKNAVLLCLLKLPRSLVAAASWVIYFIIITLFWPFSQLFLLLTNLWLPASISLLAIYLPFNESFHVEEELNQR